MKEIKFIDLFAGIGGFRYSLTKCGCKCVFSSEINDACREVYKNNYGELPAGDITKVDASQIPDFDILCAGFPCQPFSICGKKRDLMISEEPCFLTFVGLLVKKTHLLYFWKMLNT